MAIVVPLPKPSPLDIIDLESFEGMLAGAEEALGAALPVVGAAAAPAAIIAGGVIVTNQLLKWKAWDHFWFGVGATMNNVWHTAAGFLFGTGAAIEAETVGLMINLATHVSIKATRQLVGSLASKTMASIVGLNHGIRAVAHVLNNDVQSLAHRIGDALRFAEAEAIRAERYADARITTAAGVLAALSAAEVHALRAELLRDVIIPLHSEVAALGAIVRPVVVDVEHVKELLGHHVIPNLTKALATAGIAATLAHAATTWVEDCGAPMCEVAGPKTDWGRLFRLLKPAALLVLLEALAAEGPEAVERATVDFAETFGPLLDRWATSWLGLTSGDPGAIARNVGGQVGKLTL